MLYFTKYKEHETKHVFLSKKLAIVWRVYTYIIYMFSSETLITAWALIKFTLTILPLGRLLERCAYKIIFLQRGALIRENTVT